ncbi:MAG TPA: oligosaccharide flippase family protein [Vicinamibacterales bacterium]|nr:oligosaccharide flippase family protein [Vicinamibacterales bacterium]
MDPAFPSRSSRRLVHGTAAVLAAEALALPTGLITAGVLTRALGPADYGRLTLAATIVAWVQWTLTSALSRPAIRFVSRAARPEEVASAILGIYTAFGLAGLASMLVLAGPVARAMEEASLVLYIRLFAIDVVVFALAQAHRSVLIGLGRFYERAWTSAGRWLARLALIVILIQLGFGVVGAIWGSIGASVVELIIGRWCVRPRFSLRARIPGGFWVDYALPVSLAAISLRLFEKVDIVLLKSLGGTAAAAGMYGAAQNLAGVPGLFALSFSPLVLSALGRAFHEGGPEAARHSARFAIRVAVLMSPFVAGAAACADEIVLFVFGSGFEPAGPTLRLLLGGALALMIVSVTTAVLLAFEQPSRAAALTVPLVPVAVAAHVMVIPTYGTMGAATVTTVTALSAALASLATVQLGWSLLPGGGTWLRAGLVSAAVALLARLIPVDGPAVLGKLGALSAAVPALYLVLGELSVREVASLLKRAGSESGPPRVEGP